MEKKIKPRETKKQSSSIKQKWTNRGIEKTKFNSEKLLESLKNLENSYHSYHSRMYYRFERKRKRERHKLRNRKEETKFNSEKLLESLKNLENSYHSRVYYHFEREREREREREIFAIWKKRLVPGRVTASSRDMDIE